MLTGDAEAAGALMHDELRHAYGLMRDLAGAGPGPLRG
jgi:hypothetical protein